MRDWSTSQSYGRAERATGLGGYTSAAISSPVAEPPATADASHGRWLARKAQTVAPDTFVSDQVIERFKKFSSATAYSAVWRLQSKSKGEWFATADYKLCLMRGVWPMTPGTKLVGRARTLRFVPARPELLEITRRGADSPEYRAMGKCGPGDILVAEAHAADPYACILGNMKTRQLWHNKAAGIVTDGAIRDLALVAAYGLSVFARQRSPAGNLPYLEAYEDGGIVNVGGVLVMPGDLIVADDDGVVVVPAQRAEEAVAWIEEQEGAEEFVIRLIDEERVPPGKYYPISEETKRRYRESKRGH
jgi:regulator of RNase E activity RraA